MWCVGTPGIGNLMVGGVSYQIRHLIPSRRSQKMGETGDDGIIAVPPKFKITRMIFYIKSFILLISKTSKMFT